MSAVRRSPILSEDDWLRAGNLDRLADFLYEGGSSRRWRLLACHCCWRVESLLGEQGREFVAVAERMAEGVASATEVSEATAEVETALVRSWQGGREQLAMAYAMHAAAASLKRPRIAPHFVFVACGESAAEDAAQCHLLRDLFANPFRPFVFDTAWRTPTVLAIATHIYDREGFDELPVLADALEDAGCDVEILLAHLRGPTRHYRGCWALDAVLDKL